MTGGRLPPLVIAIRLEQGREVSESFLLPFGANGGGGSKNADETPVSRGILGTEPSNDSGAPPVLEAVKEAEEALGNVSVGSARREESTHDRDCS